MGDLRPVPLHSSQSLFFDARGHSGPVILMSQNRQSQKDRLSAEHDYEVNLKAELEVMLLHEKFDLLREKQWEELLVIQKEQLNLLSALTQPSA